MTRETKVGLLAGMAVILLIGILVSDHLSDGQQDEATQLDRFAEVGFPGGITDPSPSPVQTPDEADALQIIELDVPAQLRVPTPLHSRSRPRGPEPAVELTPLAPVPDVTVDDDEPAVARPDPIPTITPRKSPVDHGRILPPRPPLPMVRYHIVRENEYMGNISQTYYGSAAMWQQIQKANPKTVGRDGQVRAGVRLVIPEIEPAKVSDATVPHPDRSNPPDRNAATVRTITVKQGQTLSELARLHLGSSRFADRIYRANRDKITDPNVLPSGIELRLPLPMVPNRSIAPPAVPRRTGTPGRPAGVSARTHYTSKSGDTLSSIARKLLGNSNQWHRLYKANRAVLKDPDILPTGVKLRLPTKHE